MQQNSTFKKLIQISEEAFPPVHVPIIVGSDCFIITQQDARKIEESRFLSLSQLMPNGDLKTLNFMAPETLIELLKLKNLFDSQSSVNYPSLLDFMGYIYSKINEGQQMLQPQMTNSQPFPMSYAQFQPSPQPMEVSYPITQQVASIEQQFKWDKCNNTSAPFPMTYSQGTSTMEIVRSSSNCEAQQNKETCTNCCCCCKTCRRNNTKTVTFSRGTYTEDQEKVCKTKTENLGAREQLKQKKLSYEFS